MTAPSERVNMADDANRSSRSSKSSTSVTSTTSADILEEAFSTDSMKKFNGHGSSATIGARRGRKKPSENREEGDVDEDLNNDEIMGEIYATDSMKRFKKKNSAESPDSTPSESTEESTGRHRRTGRRRHEGDLTSIREDKSAHNLVEGLRSFRLEKERLARGSSDGNKQQKVFTSEMA